MKHTRLLLLLFALSFISYSQERSPELQKQLDSLWNIWEDNTKADTLRLKALYNYAWDGYLYSQPDSAYYFAQIQYNFASDKDLKKQMALALRLQGRTLTNGNKTLEYYHKALQLSEEINDKKRITLLLRDIGVVNYQLGNYLKALQNYEKHLTISEEMNDKMGIALMLNYIGSIYMSKGNNPKALVYFQKSLAIYEDMEDKEGIAMSYLNFGIINFQTKNYSKAQHYFHKAFDAYEKINDKYGIANSLSNLGGTYHEQDNYTAAIEYYLQAKQIYLELRDKYRTARTLENIGLAYRRQGNSSSAMEYFQKTLDIYEEVDNKSGIASVFCSLGYLYIDQENYANALEYCQRSLDLAQSMGVISEQKYSCECLYKAYKAIGNGNKALQYHEQMLVFEDSLQAEETAKKLQQMEFQKQVTKDSLETVERERKIEEAHQTEVRKKDKNKNVAIAAGIFFLLVSGGLYGRWRYTKKAKTIIEKEKDRSENLLLNILPAEVAEELKEKGEAEARDYDMVSILFTDFKGFTEKSEKLTASALVKEINTCFKAFDAICEKYNIEKIKTIGDAYMAAGGLPVPEETSVKNTVLTALEMQDFIIKLHSEKEAKGEHAFEMRVGVHTGPVVAGIVGVKKFQYDIWGDTVNTASRMESSGEIGKVNISEATYNYIKGEPEFTFESRGKIQAKGKGEVEMYFVSLA